MHLEPVIPSNFNQLKTITGRFLGKFVVKRILKLPPHHRTLHMLLHWLVKHSISEKHAINDKLQGTVATYLRRGGVVNNQIKKGLLLSL